MTKELCDGLLVVHADISAINITQKEKTQYYINGIKDRIIKYLLLDKPIIFSRYSDGIGNDNVFMDVLDKGYIIRGMSNKGNDLFDQIEEIRRITKLAKLREIEVIGGFERSCLQTTIKGILGMTNYPYGKIIGNMEIYENKASNGVKKCLKSKSLFFKNNQNDRKNIKNGLNNRFTLFR